MSSSTAPIRIFEGLDPEFVSAVMSQGRRVRFAPSEVVIEEGATPEFMLALLSGDMLIQTRTAGEGHRILARLSSGDIIGEVGLFDGHERSATVVALTDAEALRIEGADLRHILDDHPLAGQKFLQRILVDLAAKIRAANEKFRNQSIWSTGR